MKDELVFHNNNKKKFIVSYGHQASDPEWHLLHCLAISHPIHRSDQVGPPTIYHASCLSQQGRYWWAQQLCYRKLHNFHSNGSRITFSFWQGSHCVPLPDTLSHTFFLCHGQSDLGHWGMSKIHHRRSAKCFLLVLPSCSSRSEVRHSAGGPLQHPPVTLILSKRVMFPCQGNWKDHLSRTTSSQLNHLQPSQELPSCILDL